MLASPPFLWGCFRFTFWGKAAIMEPKKRKRKRENEMADVGIVFQKMLVLLLMMSVGFAAGKLGVMTQQGNHCLSVLINKVTMPCLLLHASVSGERVLGNGDVLLLTGLYFAGFALLIALARLYRLALHPAKEDGGVYELLMIFPNSAFIGIPVAAAIYGSTAVFGISLLNLPFYVALYCYGVSLIQGVPMGKVDLKQIFSPLMITSILGLALYLCNIRLPDLLAEPMQTIGQISTPGAMMLIGSTLADVPLKKAVCNWRLLLLAAGRLLLAPVAVHLVFSLFVKDEMLLGLVTLIAAMPSASFVSLLAAEYEKNEVLAAEGVFLTTILSVVTIPLMTMLLL